MITNAEKPTSMIPGVRKAAILMVVVGEHVAAEVLSRVTEDEAASLSREIARISSVPSDLAEAVLEEAYQMSVAQEYVAQGGVDYARKLLVSAYGPDTARRRAERAAARPGRGRPAEPAEPPAGHPRHRRA